MSNPGFFSELKRRQIYRGGVMYVVAGWVIVQVATTVFPIFSIPDWAIRLVVVVIMLGFPLALVGLWMFDSSGKSEDEPAAQTDYAAMRAAAPAQQAEGGERRRGADRSSDALAQLMENERLERQRANEQLLAALGEIKAGASEAVAVSSPLPTSPLPTTPTPMPAYYPVPPPKRSFRLGTLLLGVFVLILACWGIWIVVSPSIDAEAIGSTDQLAHRYVMPAYKEVEQVGAAVLRPLLQKLGIHIAPDRVFTSIMLVLALLVLRNLYRSMADARRRTRRGYGR